MKPSDKFIGSVILEGMCNTGKLVAQRNIADIQKRLGGNTYKPRTIRDAYAALVKTSHLSPMKRGSSRYYLMDHENGEVFNKATHYG